MAVITAQYAGYCSGVRLAMEKAEKAAWEAAERGVPCYMLGQIIHNAAAVKKLTDTGVRIARDIKDIPEGAMVLLRSHGAEPSIFKEAAVRKLEVIDCTCAYVRSVHEIVRKAGEDGIPVILLGDPAHPEVQATAAWCPGPIRIIRDREEAEKLDKTENAVLVCQTTLPDKAYEETLKILSGKVKNLTAHKTICAATEKRQKEALNLAEKCDRIVIVGSLSSANSVKLYETCRAVCPNTILAESVKDIPPSFIHHDKDELIGISAGASTPVWILKEVVTFMSDIEKDIVNEVAEEAAKVAETPIESPVSEEEKGKEDFMAKIDETFKPVRPGQTVNGKVVQITDEEVCVSIGYKADGIIKRDDLVDKDVQVGDDIEVQVVKLNDGEGNVILSQRNVINKKAWEALMQKFENGEFVEAVGKEAVKGGLIADVDGVRAFVPASRLDLRYVEKIDKYVGMPMKLKIIDVDQQKKRIVASRKDALIEEAKARKEEAWSKLEEGAVVTGIVRRFAAFGAFVDLGGVDGLIHVTDLSWSRINQPSEVLSINQEVQVKILSLDPERERIALGYKQLQPKPWDNIEEKYPVGVVLERPVARICSFGAFIALEPGVDGLVHISQCSLNRINKVEDVLSAGDIVRVKVLGVDPEAKRISLSIRQVLEDEGVQPEAEPAVEEAAEEAVETVENAVEEVAEPVAEAAEEPKEE